MILRTANVSDAVIQYLLKTNFVHSAQQAELMDLCSVLHFGSDTNGVASDEITEQMVKGMKKFLK